MKVSADFQTETLEARRDWHKVLKEIKSKDLQPTLFYPASLSFKNERKIKSFSDKNQKG